MSPRVCDERTVIVCVELVWLVVLDAEDKLLVRMLGDRGELSWVWSVSLVMVESVDRSFEALSNKAFWARRLVNRSGTLWCTGGGDVKASISRALGSSSSVVSS